MKAIMLFLLTTSSSLLFSAPITKSMTGKQALTQLIADLESDFLIISGNSNHYSCKVSARYNLNQRELDIKVTYKNSKDKNEMSYDYVFVFETGFDLKTKKHRVVDLITPTKSTFTRKYITPTGKELKLTKKNWRVKLEFYDGEVTPGPSAKCQIGFSKKVK